MPGMRRMMPAKSPTHTNTRSHICRALDHRTKLIKLSVAMLPCRSVNDYFAARRAQLDEYFENVAARTGAPKPLNEPLARALLSSGKRVRGVLTMAAGEAVDLHSAESALDFDTLEFIHSRKTGALFVAAAAVGAMLGNISPAALQRIEVFAKNLGLAFQITDDVLDVVGTPEQLGKDTGKDAQRLTFVKLAGVDGAKKLSDELVQTSLDAIANLGAAAQPLRDLATLVRDRVR